MSQEKKPPQLGEPGEHPLSVLLFSWMRGEGFGRTLLIAAAIACAVLAAADFLVQRHPKSAIEALPGFFGMFGFLAFAAVIAGGWLIARALRAPEDFYSRDEKEVDDDR